MNCDKTFNSRMSVLSDFAVSVPEGEIKNEPMFHAYPVFTHDR